MGNSQFGHNATEYNASVDTGSSTESRFLIIQYFLLLVSLLALSQSAFTLAARQKIWSRARGVSELTGKKETYLECSHINHDRESPYYNDPRNGILLTQLEHFCWHWANKKDPSQIGLSVKHNEMAIHGIMQRCMDQYSKKGLTRDDFWRDAFSTLPQVVKLCNERKAQIYAES